MDASSLVVVPASRRTRKRFTNAQLTMLENLFHQNSHPSREDREALARAGSMEIKSVTIWFQNKRQTERKSAVSNSGQANSFNEQNVHPNITSTIHTFSLHTTDSFPSPPLVSTRPSLDRVAARSEIRTPSSHNHSQSHKRPHSPRRLPSFPPARPPSNHHQRQLYDHLPSSPLVPPTSPPTPRDFIEFGKSSSNAKTRRTLEWACEAARIADKDKDRERDKDRDCCPSAVNPAYHRHQAHHSHQQAAYSSTEAFSTSRTLTYSSARSRPLNQDRSARDYQPRHSHRKESARESARETTRDRLARPSSSLTLRGRAEGSLSSVSTRGYTPRGHEDGDLTDSEVEEAITPPSPHISNRWTARLTKTSTNTSLTSSSSTSTTPSTSASISREGSATSTNTSFTSINSVDDDAMFKAALALCGLGRIGQRQNSIHNSMQRDR